MDGKNVDRREAPPPGQGRRQQQGGGRDDDIRPGVQFPLAGPGELDVRQNRKQIGDSPDRPVWTAAAQDISQQVDVKTEKDKEGGESFLFRKGIDRKSVV